MSRLLLLGGGHAHLFVLEALARRRLPPAEVTLVSTAPRQLYSGMLPGYLAGRYTLEEISFDLGAIAAAAGATLVQGRVVRIDAAGQRVMLEDGRTLPYDVASVAIGSVPAGSDLPGVVAHARFSRPISRVVELSAALDALGSSASPETRQVAVVGGGAAGVELALAVRARLDRQGANRAVITLYEKGPSLLRGAPSAAQALAEQVLGEQDITIRMGMGVIEVGADHVRVSGGRVIPTDLVLWATGPSAPGLIGTSGLPTDPRGYLQVDETLAVPGVRGLFGAGDAVTSLAAPLTPRNGVQAVRQAPVLVRNLAAAVRRGAGGGDQSGRPYASYTSRPRSLSLLDIGDGRAIFCYGPVVALGGWAGWLKERIDRRFLARFGRRS